MEYREHYDNMEQRELICQDYAKRGLRCLYDNFDEDWKRGDEPHGTMIFTDVMPPVEPEPEPVRDLEAEIDELKAGQKEMKAQLKALIDKE